MIRQKKTLISASEVLVNLIFKKRLDCKMQDKHAKEKVFRSLAL